MEARRSPFLGKEQRTAYGSPIQGMENGHLRTGFTTNEQGIGIRISSLRQMILAGMRDEEWTDQYRSAYIEQGDGNIYHIKLSLGEHAGEITNGRTGETRTLRDDETFTVGQRLHFLGFNNRITVFDTETEVTLAAITQSNVANRFETLYKSSQRQSPEQMGTPGAETRRPFTPFAERIPLARPPTPMPRREPPPIPPWARGLSRAQLYIESIRHTGSLRTYYDITGADTFRRNLPPGDDRSDGY